MVRHEIKTIMKYEITDIVNHGENKNDSLVTIKYIKSYYEEEENQLYSKIY